MMVHRTHAVLAPMIEYDAAPTVAHWLHAAPGTAAEYDALVDGPVVKVVHVPQVQIVVKTIEIPQLQTVGRIVDISEAQSVQNTQTSESWTSHPRRRSLSKQFFMRLMRICAVTTLRACESKARLETHLARSFNSF